MEVSKLGYGKTQKVKLIFEAVAKEKWVLQCEKLSNAWLHQFLERRPNHSFPPHSVTTSLCSGLPSSLVTPSPCSGHSPFLAVVFLPPPQWRPLLTAVFLPPQWCSLLAAVFPPPRWRPFLAAASPPPRQHPFLYLLPQWSPPQMAVWLVLSSELYPSTWYSTYVPIPKRTSKASQRVSGFWVLTSWQSLTVLQEKAKKKRERRWAESKAVSNN